MSRIILPHYTAAVVLDALIAGCAPDTFHARTRTSQVITLLANACAKGEDVVIEAVPASSLAPLFGDITPATVKSARGDR